MNLIPVFQKIVSVLTIQERKKGYMIGICQLWISMLDIASLAFLVAIVDIYTHTAPTLSWVKWIPGNWTNASLLPATYLLLFFILKNYLAYRLNETNYQFVYAVAARLSRAKMLAYLKGDFTSNGSLDSATWIKSISQRPVEFAHYLLAGVQQAFTECCLLLFAVTAIVLFNGILLFWLLILFFPALLILSLSIKRKTGGARRHIKSTGERSLQYLKEALNGYTESNLYGKNLFFTERYHQQQQKLNRHLADLQVGQAIPSRLIEVFAIAGLFLLILLQTNRVGEKWIDLVTLTAFLGFAYKCIPGVVKLFNISTQITTYQFVLEELVPMEPADAVEDNSRPGLSLEEIAIENLHFHYPGKQIFSGFDLAMGKGQLIGISGDSGQGKTTLIHLLLGFLEPISGEISFNKLRVTQDDRKTYWPLIAYIKQQTFLLHDTLKVNITLQEKNQDEPGLEAAIKMAGLSGLIESYQEGTNCMIYEQGGNISGGQRQRIALARAFYKNADLLIADEPFNELEENAVSELMDTFRKLADTGKIVLLITHQTNCLSFCDKVIAIND